MNHNTWMPTTEQNRGRWWIIYRFAPFAAFVILALLLGYLVLQPFFHPRTYLLFVAAEYPESLLPPHSSPTEDLAAIDVPQARLLNADGGEPAATHRGLASPAEFDATLQRLDHNGIQGRDVLIVSICAQVVSRCDEVDLLCENFDPMDAQAGRYPFAKLLARVRECPAETKLIVIDSGWLVHAPRLGMFADYSADQIRKLVEDTKDPSLWVMLSHSDFESSVVFAEPRRSAFAHFLGEGLQGAAGGNGEGFVDLGELYQYTQQRLADWVRSESAGRGAQTALLLWGGGRTLPGMRYPNFLPVAPGKPADQSQTAGTDRNAAPPGLHLAKAPARLGVAAGPAPLAGAIQPAEKSDKGESPAAPGAAGAKSVSDPVLSASEGELRTMAWSLHDRLAASPELGAIGNAPPFWRALQNRLVAQELAANSTDANRQAARTGELRRLVRQMSDLVEGRSPQRYQQHDMIPAMAAWTAAIEFPATVPSLALAERIASRAGRPLPPEVLAAREGLDAAIEMPDSADFRKWMAKLSPKFDAYSELRLARRLAERPDIDWPSARLALKVRCLAEKVAAETLESGLWTREQIELADRLRLAGERGLLGGVRPGDVSMAIVLLERASAEYEQAAAWNRDIVSLERLTSEALFCLPEYMRWLMDSIPASDDVSPDTVAIDRLIGILGQTSHLLDHPAVDSLPDVRRLRHELELVLDPLRKRVLGSSSTLSAAQPAPLYKYREIGPAVTALFSPQASGLIASEMRLHLLGLPDLTSDPVAARGKSAESKTGRLRKAARLYVAAFRLFLGDLPKTDKNAAALAAAAELVAKSADAAELQTACCRFGDSLADFLQSLPNTIKQLTADNQDTTDPDLTQRGRQIRNLRAARRLLDLVHPWDLDRMEFSGPGQPLERAALYDLLVWQQRRAAAEIADSQPGELSSLVGAANAYRRAAAAVPLQPPISEIAPPGIEVESPREFDLASRREIELPVSVANRRDHEVSVWLAADFDSKLLSVEARDKGILYDQADLRRLSVTAGGGSRPAALNADPARPDLGTLSPTFKLQAGETKVLWVQLRRKTLAGGDARVAFRAISRWDDVRRDLMVMLPHLQSVDLVADGIADSWRSEDSVLTLYPFPNRTTPYTLYLVNSGAAECTVDLELLRADNPASLLPRGDVSAGVVDDYLAHLGAASLLKIEKIVVPSGRQRVPIPFLAAAKPPKPPAADKPEAAAPKPSLKDAPLSPTLLAVLTDRGTSRRVIIPIEIFTQRPARYVCPRVEFDPERRRVDIVVQPIKPSAIPPEGVWIEGQAEQAASVEGQHPSGAWLRPPATETTVHVEVPRDVGALLPMHVNIDGFDRAFRYEVPTGATSRTPVPESSRVGAKILEPRPGTCFGPKTSEVPVSLQIDAPHGLLLDGKSFIEVGIDTNRDRELRHKETVRLTSDRQVELFLDSVGANGRLAIRTKVSDLRVTLPPPKLKAMRANILARVDMGTSDAWSPPIEVIFDDEPPRLSRLQLTPGAIVTQGDELEVSVLASDHELSGVAKVEAAFDLQQRGEFGEPPPLPASMQSDGRWSVKLPTKPLRPGIYGIIVRATDKVGNASEYLKSSLEIVPADSGAKHPPLGRITGKVVYGRFEKRPVGGAVVQLTAAKGEQTPREVTTDDDGQFSIADVSPGDFTLKVEKLIAGNRRIAKSEVKVPTPPAAAGPVELILEMPR
jgi:hypothetical protein